MFGKLCWDEIPLLHKWKHLYKYLSVGFLINIAYTANNTVQVVHQQADGLFLVYGFVITWWKRSYISTPSKASYILCIRSIYSGWGLKVIILYQPTHDKINPLFMSCLMSQMPKSFIVLPADGLGTSIYYLLQGDVILWLCTPSTDICSVLGIEFEHIWIFNAK